MYAVFGGTQRFDTIGDDVSSIIELACIATAAYLIVSTEKRTFTDIALFVTAVFLCALVYQLLVRLVVPADYYQQKSTMQQQPETN
jgi:hypothetical protein